MKLPTLLAVALMGFAGAAGAAEAASPFYVGAGAGRTQTDCFTACTMFADSGKLVAGYSFPTISAWPGSQIIGSIELAGFRAGKDRVAMNAAGAFDATGLYYKATLRETEALSLSARVGVAHTRAKVTIDDGRQFALGSNRLAMGLGLSYALDKNWTVTADYDHLKLRYFANEMADAHMLSIGAGYRF